jgi:hypothetical protein
MVAWLVVASLPPKAEEVGPALSSACACARASFLPTTAGTQLLCVCICPCRYKEQGSLCWYL